MKLIVAVIRPEQLSDVLEALFHADVRGLTISRVQGHGGEIEHVENYRGTSVKMALAEKVRLEIGVSNHFVETTIDAILLGARTGEVGDGNDVELAEGVLDAEVAVVKAHLLDGGLEGKSGQGQLVRGRADAHRDVVSGTLAADEIADQQGNQVGRHFRCAGERDGVLARVWSRRIRELFAVRDHGVALVDHERDIKRRLVRGLIE